LTAVVPAAERAAAHLTLAPTGGDGLPPTSWAPERGRPAGRPDPRQVRAGGRPGRTARRRSGWRATAPSAARPIQVSAEELRALERRSRPTSGSTRATRRRAVLEIGAQAVRHLAVLLHCWQALAGGQGRDKGLGAHAGRDPHPRASGTGARGHLFPAALGGMRGDNAPRRFYRRPVDRGQAKELALVGAARKLLAWAGAVCRR
jgi:hypothetical protein